MDFPTTPVLDAFNRADGALGATWTGPAFGDTSAFTISSNTIAGGTPDSSDVWTNETFGPNSEVYCDITTLPTAGSKASVFCRLTGTTAAANGYNLRYLPTGTTFQLRRWDASVGTVLSSAVQAVSAGDSIGLSVSGSTLKAWYKPAAGVWTMVVSATDATYSNAGYLGTQVGDTTCRLDSFGGGTVQAIQTLGAGPWF